MKLSVFDLRGRRVAVLVDGWRDSGEQRVVWEGTDASGRRLASGAYVLELRAGTARATAKALLLR